MTLDVAADAAIGKRDLRIYSIQGGSSPRPFLIGAFPEIIESDDKTPASISLPVTINGQISPKADIDEYQLSLDAGQQIVCLVAAASIGSPGDVVLNLFDENGRKVASANDYRGSDPLLVFRSRQAGKYLLKIHNYDLSGGIDHVYRLTITAGPVLEYAFLRVCSWERRATFCFMAGTLLMVILHHFRWLPNSRVT